MLSGGIGPNSDILNSLCLIDFAAMFSDSKFFAILIGPMVSWENKKLLPASSWHHSSAIPNVGNITGILDKHDYDGTRSRFVILTRPSISILQKLSFCSETAICKGLCRVCRKTILIYYNGMQALLEKICTCATPMSIIDGEIWAFGPLMSLRQLFALGLCHIKDDWNSILVITPLKTLMGIRCIGNNESVGFRSIFSSLKILQRVLQI